MMVTKAMLPAPMPRKQLSDPGVLAGAMPQIANVPLSPQVEVTSLPTPTPTSTPVRSSSGSQGQGDFVPRCNPVRARIPPKRMDL